MWENCLLWVGVGIFDDKISIDRRMPFPSFIFTPQCLFHNVNLDRTNNNCPFEKYLLSMLPKIEHWDSGLQSRTPEKDTSSLLPNATVTPTLILWAHYCFCFSCSETWAGHRHEDLAIYAHNDTVPACLRNGRFWIQSGCHA